MFATYDLLILSYALINNNHKHKNKNEHEPYAIYEKKTLDGDKKELNKHV